MSVNAHELDLKNVEKSVINTVRGAIGVSGAVSLIIGVLILVWPVKTAVVVAGIIAVYAVIAGVVNLAIGIFSRRIGGWARFGFLALGAVFLIAAIVSFSNLGAAAAGLAVLVGVLFGISWIVEGVVGLTLIGDSASKVWTIVYALISIVAGILVLTSPLWGAALLWLWLGVSLVVMGIVQIVRAIRFGSQVALTA
ncbi:MAG TPA: DUF308 domain-containing protein [Propionicimonas sp.]|jgi:uncharacterized membrane protein HdeD (DUF308 family)|uniref:HdeD family acid-resistance protein n=1 Tax=Propionicimonas sp. TaxID=1955623 RepID=UPI002F406D98